MLEKWRTFEINPPLISEQVIPSIGEEFTPFGFCLPHRTRSRLQPRRRPRFARWRRHRFHSPTKGGAAPPFAAKPVRAFDKREDSESRLWPFLDSFHVNQPLDAAKNDDNVTPMKAPAVWGSSAARLPLRRARAPRKNEPQNIAFSDARGR